MIQSLGIRGAPAIGVAGAYAAVLAVREAASLSENEARITFLETALEEIASSRPTAINLRWAIERMRALWARRGTLSELEARWQAESELIHLEDRRANERMAGFGAEIIPPGAALTYCNTGGLATSGKGTALGVLEEGFRQKKISHVYACETRPVLQGLRLTAWELSALGIPYTILCDNAAASFLARGEIKSVWVGADRIARNGDVANKIGTYGLAVLARHHGVPFYVAAPSTSVDLATTSGKDIPIEERPAEEVTALLGESEFRPQVANPAFDVTPAELVTAWICERGVFQTAQRLAAALLDNPLSSLV